MKKADIEVGGEYAVGIGHVSQGTSAGARGLVKATVTGWVEGRYGKPAQVVVTLAEPYKSPYGSPAYDGKTEFVLATRSVISTWADHEPAAERRLAREAEEKVAADRKKQAETGARQRLMALIPEEHWPSFLKNTWQTHGSVTLLELLAIVEAVQQP